MRASSPLPAITANDSPLTSATSMRRTRPVTASSTASSPEGSSKLAASRLPVPRGTIPSTVSVPASGARHARTVPSPPQATTVVAPDATASAAWPAPGSSSVVFLHSTGRPSSSNAVRSSSSETALPLAGLTTATVTPSPSVRVDAFGARRSWMLVMSAPVRMGRRPRDRRWHVRRARQGGRADQRRRSTRGSAGSPFDNRR